MFYKSMIRKILIYETLAIKQMKLGAKRTKTAFESRE